MRKQLWVLVVLCGLAVGVSADGRLRTSVSSYKFSEGYSAFLDPISELWGYIDKNGIVQIPAQYDGAEPFSSGLAVVSVVDDFNATHSYVIDKQGTVLFEPEEYGYSLEYDFDEGSLFKNGLAVARTDDRQFAFIDASGKIVREFKYTSLSPLSEGLASFSTTDTLGKEIYGFIDAKGTEVIPARFSYAGSFHDGLAYATLGSGEAIKQVYIDKTGTVVNELKFDTGDFSEGLAGGSKEGGSEGQDDVFVFIDKSGKEVLTLEGYDQVGLFSSGRAMVRKDYYYTGFIDKTGKEIVEPTDEYGDASNFSEGLAAVVIGNRIGFIDMNGKLVIPAVFSASVPGKDYEGRLDLGKYSFSEGLSPYYDAESSTWGFIDINGEIAIEAGFDGVHGFSDGLAQVAILNDDYEFIPVFIDRYGETVIDPSWSGYTVLSDFSSNLALVRQVDGQLGYIDTNGNMVLTPEYPELGQFSDDMAVFGVEIVEKTAFGPMKTMRYGYIDVNGKAVIPATFVSAQPFSEGLAYVQIPSAAGKEDKTGYIDKTGTLVLEFTSEDQSFSEGLVETADLFDTPEGTTLMVFDFYDRNGKNILSVDTYRWVSFFAQGRARMLGKRDRMGFIDKTGKEIIPPLYKAANNFSEGLAAVAIGGLVGFIDLNGKLVIPARFDAPELQSGKGGDPIF